MTMFCRQSLIQTIPFRVWLLLTQNAWYIEPLMNVSSIIHDRNFSLYKLYFIQRFNWNVFKRSCFLRKFYSFLLWFLLLRIKKYFVFVWNKNIFFLQAKSGSYKKERKKEEFKIYCLFPLDISSDSNFFCSIWI